MAIPGRMTKFRIDELSGVDRPAQAGAKVTFFKRATPTINVEQSSGTSPAGWDLVKAGALEQLDAGAREVALATGISYEKAYSQLLASCPLAAAAAIR